MDPLVDFMPSQDEFKIIVNNIQNSVHRKRVSHPVNGHTEKLYPGILSYDYYKLEEKNNKKFCVRNKDADFTSDTYDDLGRNSSKQERRQELVPWVKVNYRKGKLYIPVDKKNALRSLRLL